MKTTLTTLGLALWMLSEATAAEPGVAAKSVRAFLDAHCVDCHGKQDPEGNVSLPALSFDSKAPQDIETWKRIYEQLDSGQMPPQDAKKQPRSADRQFAIMSIKSTLKAAGVKIDELKELAPARGNRVDHDALFSGKAVGEAGTPSRVWRLSPESYKQFFIRLNGQLSLGLDHILWPSSSREAPLNAPWNLARKWEFTDYSSLHRISGAEYEHHLRNCKRVTKEIVAKRWSSLKKLAGALSAGKSATPEQLEAAVAETFDALLRLPLDSAALKSQSEYLAKLLQSMDAPLAGEQFLISVLCHPVVLYRIERPDGDAKRGLMPPRHTARAISFTLTDREPDAVLWQAAVEGDLTSSEAVRQHVERILNDPAIPKPRLLGFFQEYFGYTTAPNVAKDFITVNHELQSSIGCGFQMGFAGNFVTDTDRLVEWVLESDKEVLRTLLTTRKSFLKGNFSKQYHKRRDALLERKKLNAERAAREGKPVDESNLNYELKKLDDGPGSAPDTFNGSHASMSRDTYGVQRTDPEKHWANVVFERRGKPVLISKPRAPKLNYDEWLAGKPYDVHPEEQMGILTQSSWLVAMSSNFDNHAIHRGRWIRERLLGGRILEVPITVNAMLPNEPHRGLRDRMRVTREEYCWKCHKQMDPLGLPFEQFDHIGRYRTAEIVVDKEQTDKDRAKNANSRRTMTSMPIDTTGAITDSGDPQLDGPVNGPFELIEKLSKSKRVEQVFVRHVFRYFLGRNETLADGPTLVAAHKAYRESGGSFKALLVSLLSSESFLHRTVPTIAKES
ncbi:MAG: hypothetical protein ACI8TX_002092 [Hyphomicrobiaceae bacterium]|jgi:hypothetical protein